MYTHVNPYWDKTLKIGYECRFYNPTTDTSRSSVPDGGGPGGIAIVIPTSPNSYYAYSNVQFNITQFSCGFLKRNLATRPTFPSSTVLWTHYIPRGGLKPSYHSDGCLFNSASKTVTKPMTVTKTSTTKFLFQNCINLCYFPLDMNDPSIWCTHFNYSPSDLKCTRMFSGVSRPPLASSATFATSSTGSICGFIFGRTTQGAV